MSFRGGGWLFAAWVSALAAAAPAHAAPPSSEGPTGLVLGLKAGGGIGAPLNDSGTSFAAEFELGYVLPPIDHALELFAAFAYASPGMDGSADTSDPRLPGDGVLSYRVEQQIGALGLGLRYRLHLGSDLITPYAGAGGRLYMMRTEVSGTVGDERFNDNRETTSVPGAFLALGVELALGPGALLLEVQGAYGGVDAYVLRDTNVGMLSLMLGYRLMLPRARVASSPAEYAEQPERAERMASGAPRSEDEALTQAEPASEPAPPAAGLEDGASAAPLAPDPPASVEAAPAAALAQVRGKVRAFSGKPLRATIRLKPLGLKVETDAQGYFQIDVPPGRYRVRLRSFGYVSQSREIAVEENGVTVLNVELRKK